MNIKCLAVVPLCTVAPSALSEHLKVNMSASGHPSRATGFENRATVNAATNTHTTTSDSITATGKKILIRKYDFRTPGSNHVRLLGHWM